MRGGEKDGSVRVSIAQVNGFKVGRNWLPHRCDLLSKAGMGN